MIVAVTVFHCDVVTDLPADAVAVVVEGGHPADRDVAAVLQEDAAGVVAVQVLVVGPVAVEREVLDHDAGHELAAEDGEQRGHGGVAHQPDVLAQGPVELEAVAGAGDERPLDDDRAVAVRVLGPQADAVAEAKTGRVGKGDLLIVPVRINAELRLDRRLLDKHGVRTAAGEADLRGEINGIAEAEGSRTETDGAAAQAGDGIDGGLDDFFVGTDQVALVGADGQGKAFVPFRLDEVEGRGPRLAHFRPIERLLVVGRRLALGGRRGRGQRGGSQKRPAVQ